MDIDKEEEDVKVIDRDKKDTVCNNDIDKEEEDAKVID